MRFKTARIDQQNLTWLRVITKEFLISGSATLQARQLFIQSRTSVRYLQRSEYNIFQDEIFLYRTPPS